MRWLLMTVTLVGCSTNALPVGGAGTVVGDPDLGLSQFLGTLEVGRISIAALSLSLTQAVLDLALDYARQLGAACPAGIDVYFENVGGAVQQAVWPLLNDFARIPVCGLIAQHSAATPMPGPDMFSVLRKRLTLRGFIVSDFAAKQADFLREAGDWVRSARKNREEPLVFAPKH